MFEGIYPAAITPFDENEDVDEEKLREFLDFLIDGGVHGIYLLGTNGESTLLDKEEKKRVIDVGIDHVDGRVPVIAGTMVNSTKDAVELARYAEEVGADAVHAILPYYFPISTKSMVDHYSKISDSVDIPLFVYSIPQRTGNELTVDMLKELAQIENVKGVKDSSGDVQFFYEALNEVRDIEPDFHFFGGNDTLIYSYLTLGSSGSVTAVGNVFPEMVSSLYDSYKEGDMENAKQIQDKVMRVKRVMSRGPYMAEVKGVLKLRDRDFGELKSPLESLSSEQLDIMEKELKEIGVL